MVRVKRGTAAHKRRKSTLKQTKGFRWGRKSKYRLAKEALIHAWQYAYRDRKVKKRVFRAAWEQQINAAAREHGIPYNQFIHGLKENNIQLDRKVLGTLAKERPDLFEQVLNVSKKKQEV